MTDKSSLSGNCRVLRLDNIKIYASDRAIKIFQYLQHPVVAGVTAGAAVNRVITGKDLYQFGCCYSTVTFVRCRGAFSIRDTDLLFSFGLVTRSSFFVLIF